MKLFFLLPLLNLFISNQAYAGGDSFQVAPPPIAYPVYGQTKTDTKTSVNITSMEGKNLDMTGFGVDYSARTTKENSKGAMNFAFGINHMTGDFSTNGEITMTMMTIQLGGEVQLIKEDKFSMIGFMSLSLTYFTGSTDTTGSSYSSETDVYGSIYGLPFGAQFGFFPTDEWTIAPFIMVNYVLSGSVTSDSLTTTNSTSSFSSTDSDIDSYLAPSYGFDVIYEPWKVSAGGFLQAAKGGGDSGEIDTTVWRVSWNKSF